MQSQVIVPLDGSASAEAILPHALLFAQRGRSILTMLMTFPSRFLQLRISSSGDLGRSGTESVRGLAQVGR